jgi:hypothetical protein
MCKFEEKYSIYCDVTYIPLEIYDIGFNIISLWVYLILRVKEVIPSEKSANFNDLHGVITNKVVPFTNLRF